jgi:hypothetical protein
MPTSAPPQVTDFSRDLIGRCVCNGLDERLRSRRAARELSRASNSRARGRLLVDGRPQLLEEEAAVFPAAVAGHGCTAGRDISGRIQRLLRQVSDLSFVWRCEEDDRPVSVFEATLTITDGDLHAADVSSSGDDDDRRVANQQ